MGKLVILTGAPESDRLDWSAPDLLQTFLDPIARFAQLQPQTETENPSPPTCISQQEQKQQQQQDDKSALDLAVWRSLPLRRSHIPTGFSQQHDLQLLGHYPPSSADFLTTAGISFEAASQGQSQEEGSRLLLAEFYEHSLAVHDDLASSQLVPPSQTGDGPPAGTSNLTSGSDAGSKTTTSFTTIGEDNDDDSTTLLADQDATAAIKPPLQQHGPGGAGRPQYHRLSDLQDIPPARHLLSILPQTVTVSLVVGVISIAAPRTVATRYGVTKTLVEVLVGDDTRSGFSVTFWLDGSPGPGGGGLGGVLAGLRGQDVVLMQNVALNAFRGKVYGGSLRRDMTKVSLLYRGRRLDGDDVAGYYSYSDLARAGRLGTQQQQQHPQLVKAKRVRDWVLKFVGGGPGVVIAGTRRSTRTRRGRERPPRRDWNQPPPLDSQ